MLLLVLSHWKGWRDRVTFFPTWSNLSTLKVQTHKLNRCWKNSYVGHEFKFFGSLETWCSRSHLACPILCSPLLQRRYSLTDLQGLCSIEFSRSTGSAVCDTSPFHWGCGAIKSPVWKSVEMILFLQILYGEVTVGSRPQWSFLPLVDVTVSHRYIPAIVDHTGGLPCQGTFLLHQVLMKAVEQQVSPLWGALEC